MRKKYKNKRVVRTPEQIALTCRSAAQAAKLGKDVHRAFMMQEFERLNPASRYLVQKGIENLGSLPPEQQPAALRAIRAAKTSSELAIAIENIKNTTEDINESTKEITTKDGKENNITNGETAAAGQDSGGRATVYIGDPTGNGNEAPQG